MLWKRNGALGVVVVSPNLCEFKSPLNIAKDNVKQLNAVRALNHGYILDCNGDGFTISLSFDCASDKIIGYLLWQK